MNDQFAADIVSDLLKRLQIDVDSISLERIDAPPTLKIVVSSPNGDVLTSNSGEYFNSLNYLIRRILEKPLKESNTRIFLDINGYQEALIEEIKRKANIFADRAKYFRTSVELDPMPAYERMIVHTHFESDPNIITNSTGYGKMRRVVLSYKNSENLEDSEV